MGLPSDRAFEALRRDFAGDVVTPDSVSYDDARTVFNAMIQRRPAALAQCASPEDVAAALAFAQQHGLEIAIRGGGHSVAGKGVTEGGLVIDLRRMNTVSVDPTAMTARIGGGATMSHLDRATQPHGLATTGGRVSTTGVGGFTLGGGTGWLDRKFGLACDNLVSVDLVTAEGKQITASGAENRELFWALHGGGGNFGVATSLTLRLYPLASITAALLFWPAENGPSVLRAFRDYVENAPDEVGGGAIYLTGPEAEFVPPALVGQLAFALLVVFAGGEDEARRAIAPMLELGHLGGMVAEMPYADLQSMLDDPPGYRNYWSAEYLMALPDEAVDLFCARAADMIVPSASQHVLFPGGGRVRRETADWPVPWRTAPWCAHPFGLWSDPADDDRGQSWARNILTDLKPWSAGNVYLNFIGDEGADRVVAGFGAENYRRLARVKRDYDPGNVFQLNHNIRPA
ncbi:FAD-binding oxidoreductase [Devosia sp. CN2-171]|uniref:FAD-binding oxidoreductase n=1 Tax=Devosia sp. CN2-171 TaxID=3400909 RepID=UPI003BF7AAA4